MSNKIHTITAFIEKRKLGFGVARLLMLSGVDVRKFQPTDPDPTEDLARVLQALPSILSSQEIQELQRHLKGE